MIDKSLHSWKEILVLFTTAKILLNSEVTWSRDDNKKQREAPDKKWNRLKVIEAPLSGAFFRARRQEMRKGTRRPVSPAPVGARIRKILRFINICTAQPANISKSIWTMPVYLSDEYDVPWANNARTTRFFFPLALPFSRHFSPG